MSLRYLPVKCSRLPARLATLAITFSAIAYSCAPDFDRLTSDNGKGEGGRGGSGDCVGDSCGGSGGISGTPSGAGTDSSNIGGAGEGGTADGGAPQGGTNEGGAGEAGTAQGGTADGGAPQGGAGEGGAGGFGEAGIGGTGQGGSGKGGSGQGGSGTGGKAGSAGIEPDPELPVLECGGTACAGANVLADMEANDGKVCATGGRSGGTFYFNDGTGDQWPPPDPLGFEQFSPLEACRGTSAVALHTKGNVFTSWGAGVVIKFSEQGWDASAYKGMTFWAKSPTRTRITFGIATTETQDVAYGGDCVPRDGLQCADHFSTSRTINTGWMAYTITFSEMRQRGFGVPAPSTTINTATMTELNITFPTGQPFDVWIDDVVFTE